MFLFSGLSGPAVFRPSTLQDIAQGHSGVEPGSDGPGTGRKNGPLGAFVCVQLLPDLTNLF